MGNLLDDLIEEHGFMPHRNPTIKAYTGTIILGGPQNLTFVEYPDECFPEERIKRYRDKIHFQKKIHYTFQKDGKFKLFGLGLSHESAHQINVVIDGITIESLALFEVIRLIETMEYHCIESLSYGDAFIIESLIVDNIQLFITDNTGNSIKMEDTLVPGILSSANISWQSEGQYTLIIKNPVHLGYRLAQLLPGDEEMTLKRSDKAYENENKFVFELLTTIPFKEEFFSKF